MSGSLLDGAPWWAKILAAPIVVVMKVSDALHSLKRKKKTKKDGPDHDSRSSVSGP